MDVGDSTPPENLENSTNPNEPFVVVALALIVYTSPDDPFGDARTSR